MRKIKGAFSRSQQTAKSNPFSGEEVSIESVIDDDFFLAGRLLVGRRFCNRQSTILRRELV
jgi:hypothetical protein